MQKLHIGLNRGIIAGVLDKPVEQLLFESDQTASLCPRYAVHKHPIYQRPSIVTR